MQSQPILVSHLFPVLDAKLLELLRSLNGSDWSKFALPKWTVKDVAAHLLDGNVRRLSMGRDGHWGEKFGGSSYQELVHILTQMNADWVNAFRRVSPALLIEMLAFTGAELSAYVQSLDPFSPAVFPVAWAGEEQSANWFDIAREYTEKWHHQQQIRMAVAKPGIMEPDLYFPVLDTFMRALPHVYRDVAVAGGTGVRVQVVGESGGVWELVRHDDRWTIGGNLVKEPAATILIPEELAWKLFTKGLRGEEKLRAIQVTGDIRLGEPIQSATAIMG